MRWKFQLNVYVSQLNISSEGDTHQTNRSSNELHLNWWHRYHQQIHRHFSTVRNIIGGCFNALCRGIWCACVLLIYTQQDESFFFCCRGSLRWDMTIHRTHTRCVVDSRMCGCIVAWQFSILPECSARRTERIAEQKRSDFRAIHSIWFELNCEVSVFPKLWVKALHSTFKCSKC